MNRLIMAVCVATAVLGAKAEDPDGYAEWGEVIELWPENAGRFALVNAQSKASDKIVEAAETQLTRVFTIRFAPSKGKMPEIREVPAELKRLGAKGGIWLVDDPKLPTVIAACENGWGLLNVGALAVDNPDEKKLEGRLVKELNRLFAYIHGASESMMVPGCVTKPAHGLEGLDKLTCSQISPEAYTKIGTYLRQSGYKMKLTGYYREACEQGWAPAPTNAVQKGIWDKVHQLPKAPIKIKPETTKITK